MQSDMLKSRLETSITEFVTWLSENGDISYDRMDYWSSKSGILAKKLFYKSKFLGAPLAILGLLLENFFPNIQKLYNKPHREIIGDAHLALGFLNLYEITRKREYLEKAEYFLNEMLKYSSNGYSGLCWGYSFGWQTTTGFWKPKTPLMAITPYAFWAFKKHYSITDDQESKQKAISIAEFALNDIPAISMPNGTKSSGYSPIGTSVVINTNTYRAAILMDAFQLSNNIKYKNAAEDNIKFAISYQGNNGEWYYEAKDDKKNNFIDNFHTCFVLRNLYKCYLVNNDKNLFYAIKKGYNYYINNLFYKNGRPKHFAKAKYAKLRKYEMYDYAEGITLGVLLKEDIPEALDKAIWLADDLTRNFQTKKGYFITRVTTLGTMHRVPYLRWPQAQLFYALTNLLKGLKS